MARTKEYPFTTADGITKYALVEVDSKGRPIGKGKIPTFKSDPRNPDQGTQPGFVGDSGEVNPPLPDKKAIRAAEKLRQQQIAAQKQANREADRVRKQLIKAQDRATKIDLQKATWGGTTRQQVSAYRQAEVAIADDHGTVRAHTSEGAISEVKQGKSTTISNTGQPGGKTHWRERLTPKPQLPETSPAAKRMYRGFYFGGSRGARAQQRFLETQVQAQVEPQIDGPHPDPDVLIGMPGTKMTNVEKLLRVLGKIK